VTAGLPETASLRDVAETDFAIFFEHQRDADANRMAAFTAVDPADRSAFMDRWRRILDDETIIKKTVLYGGRVAGHVVSFLRFGHREVGYWIGREFWGRGVATASLAALLLMIPVRPLHARVAKDNLASIRVLEKCGFILCGEDRGFSNARGEEVEERLFVLRE